MQRASVSHNVCREVDSGMNGWIDGLSDDKSLEVRKDSCDWRLVSAGERSCSDKQCVDTDWVLGLLPLRGIGLRSVVKVGGTANEKMQCSVQHSNVATKVLALAGRK